MIIGFSGTRNGMTEVQVTLLEGLLPGKMLRFLHGSCYGADVEAAQLARTLFGKRVLIVAYPGIRFGSTTLAAKSNVDDWTMPVEDYLERNRRIVHDCDELIACPGEGVSKGTWYTIKYARKCGKPVTIIHADGAIE